MMIPTVFDFKIDGSDNTYFAVLDWNKRAYKITCYNDKDINTYYSMIDVTRFLSKKTWTYTIWREDNEKDV